MIKKLCKGCGQNTWHNIAGKPDNADRCTYCGYPMPKTSHETKAAIAQSTFRRQVAKVRLT